MSAPTCLYDQVLSLLRQYSHRRDLRHLKALAWMVTAWLPDTSLESLENALSWSRSL